MELDLHGAQPIYLQVAQALEDAILSGLFAQGEPVPSTTELSITYKINPATALKGVYLLVDEGILYKKRGVGMFVAQGAQQSILHKRQRQFYDSYILQLVREARRLHLSQADVQAMLRKGFGGTDHE